MPKNQLIGIVLAILILVVGQTVLHLPDGWGRLLLFIAAAAVWGACAFLWPKPKA